MLKAAVSVRTIHHDRSEPLAPQTTHSVRPHGQKHQRLKHDYRKPKSRCLLRISSLCEEGSISVCSVCQWTTRVQMHNMHDPACIRQQNIQNALTLDYGTQLEAWLQNSSTHSDGSNARSTNGPLRWPAPGQAKETLDSLLRSLMRLHAEQARICSLSEEHPVGLSCGLVTTGFWETSSDHKLMNVPLSEHSTDVGEVMC